jgi:hypothetical protein
LGLLELRGQLGRLHIRGRPLCLQLSELRMQGFRPVSLLIGPLAFRLDLLAKGSNGRQISLRPRAERGNRCL